MSFKFISPDYKISKDKSVLERSKKYKGTEKYLVCMQLPRLNYYFVTFYFNSTISNPAETSINGFIETFYMYEISGKYK